MKHTRKILLTCTNDAGSNYGDSGFIDGQDTWCE